MRAQLRLGSVRGIPVGANWSVLAVFVLFAYLLATSILPGEAASSRPGYWAVGLGVAVLFFGALLAHELGHALLARHFGVPVRGITLWMLGGVSEFDGEASTPGQHLAIALIGPLVSLAAGVLFGLAAYVCALGHAPKLVVAGLVWLAATNVLLTVFNLLPGAPLDGGRVLQALLWVHWHDRARAAAAAARAGRGLGAGLVGIGLIGVLFTVATFDGLWLVLIGWFVLSASSAEERAAARTGVLAGVTVGEVMSRELVTLPAYRQVDDALEQIGRCRQETFPVVDLDARLLGLVDADTLAHLPAAHRRDRRVGDLATPLARLPATTPDEPLAQLVERTGGHRPAVVFSAGHFVGVVTREDLLRAMRRAAADRSGAFAGR